jgi:GAF domain-containing protein/HAMP domain-containing protein
MNIESRLLAYLNKLLSNWGASYILRMQIFAQIVSSLAVFLGLGYLFLNIKFTPSEIRQLIIAGFALISLSNFIVFISIKFLTTNARQLLDSHTKTSRLLNSEDELKTENEKRAWKEITAVVWRFSIEATLVGFFLVVIPLSLYMYVVVKIDLGQAIHVALGGLMSIIGGVTLNTLLLDFLMIPPRLALIPTSFESQLEGVRSSHLRGRLQLLVFALIVIALLMVSPRAYQEAVDAMNVNGVLAGNLSRLQIQLLIVAAIALIIGAFFTNLMSRTIDIPIQNLIRTMNEVQKGNLNQRAEVIGTDEIGQLSIYFNQALARLQELQTNLEDEVAKRTAELAQKTSKLQAASQIARRAASVKNIDELLDTIVKMTSEEFGFYHTGLFLTDERKEYVVLQAASSEGGNQMLQREHRLRIGSQGIVGAVAYQRQPRIAVDVGADAVFFNNPDLPETRSEMALPLIVRDEVIGVLDFQSTKSEAFLYQDLEVMETLADQIALAIENSRLLTESQSIIQQLQLLSSEKTQSAWDQRNQHEPYAYTYSPQGIQPGKKKNNDPELASNYLEIPIETRGQRIGRIKLIRKDKDANWSDREKNVTKEVAAQVGLALESARLLEDSLKQAQREKTVSDVSSKIRETLDIDTVLKTAAQEFQQIFGLEEAEVRLGATASTFKKRKGSNGHNPNSNI